MDKAEDTKDVKKEKKTKKKISAIDKYLIFVFASVVLYIIAALFIFYRTALEPSTLTTSVFAFFGGEVTILALIKRLKLKKEDKDENEEEKEKEEKNIASDVVLATKTKLAEATSHHMAGDDDAVG